MEYFNVAFAIAFIGPPIIWRFGPKRSELWRLIKLWAEDNELAALVREERRASRKPNTATVSDNGREFRVEERA